jgi:hypothetical protein
MFWCVSCFRMCPGHDEDGFCRLADREGDPRLRRREPVTPELPASRDTLHHHDPVFAEYRVLLDGEELADVWWACTVNEFRGGAGSVQLTVPNSLACRYRTGRVEILRHGVAAAVVPVPVAAPAPVPPPVPKLAPGRAEVVTVRQLCLLEFG